VTFVAKVSAKSSGDPEFHSTLWKALMDGIDGPGIGDEGGEGRSAVYVVPSGDGRGRGNKFLAIPALLMSMSM
jgi:hypothetical protein